MKMKKVSSAMFLFFCLRFAFLADLVSLLQRQMNWYTEENILLDGLNKAFWF